MVAGTPGIRPGKTEALDILDAIVKAQSDMIEAIDRVGETSHNGRRLLPKLVLLSQEVGRAQQDLYWAMLEGRP